MASVNVHGRDLKPGKWVRVGRTTGKAYLMVCAAGNPYYVDEEGTRHDPPLKGQVDELFNIRYPGTKCTWVEDPDC